MSILITGGAGFIGSHLNRSLSEEFKVKVLDRKLNGDCTNRDNLKKALKNVETVFHLAAYSKSTPVSETVVFRENIYASFLLLQTLKSFPVKHLVFASSSAVYGNASEIPTKEDYGPLKPVSVYGASKLACESLILAYAKLYNFKATILRLANVIGTKGHGVVYDLTQRINQVKKLKKTDKAVSVLGNGTQNKSYIYISDCISGFLTAWRKQQSQTEIFNLGSETQITVKQIAELIARYAGVPQQKFFFDSEPEGWNGDTVNMWLDISKLKRSGWKPKYSSETAVVKTVKSLLFTPTHLVQK